MSTVSNIEVKENGVFSYEIVLTDTFGLLKEKLESLGCAGHRICIVSDSNVAPLYLEQVREIVSSVCKQTEVFVFEAGEASKTLDVVRQLYEVLIQAGFDRQDKLLALGGGVVGDLTGYTAATFLRGIPFIQVPTTLLSQVDSSIGGKTGVDFAQYKNMVGAFHQPSLVYMNISVLQTLPGIQFASGMGEVLKSGLIRDAEFYEWTINNMAEIMERDTEALLKMIYTCCNIKRVVVENDPKEKGERALLNFGHTIGHAIEKLKNFELLHGECVALGTVAAAFMSWKRGYIDEDEFYEIRDMNVGFGLPITFDGLESSEILAATKKDKKMNAGKIRFILLKELGDAYVDLDVTEEEMLAAIDSLNAALIPEDASAGIFSGQEAEE